MHLRALLGDVRAVSPVIGVVLLISITTILAGLVGTFVLGVSKNVFPAAPQATFDYEYGDLEEGSPNTELRITHVEGEPLQPSQIHVQWLSTEGTWNGLATGEGGLISPGTSVVIGDGEGGQDTSGSSLGEATVRLIWTGEDGDTSAILSTFDVPERPGDAGDGEGGDTDGGGEAGDEGDG